MTALSPCAQRSQLLVGKVVAAALAVVLLFLIAGVSSAGAVTTLNTCYGRIPTIVGTTDAGETIQGTPGDDVIVAGAGNDQIFTNGGHDFVCAGGGADLVVDGTDQPGPPFSDPVVF